MPPSATAACVSLRFISTLRLPAVSPHLVYSHLRPHNPRRCSARSLPRSSKPRGLCTSRVPFLKIRTRVRNSSLPIRVRVIVSRVLLGCSSTRLRGYRKKSLRVSSPVTCPRAGGPPLAPLPRFPPRRPIFPTSFAPTLLYSHLPFQSPVLFHTSVRSVPLCHASPSLPPSHVAFKSLNRDSTRNKGLKESQVI